MTKTTSSSATATMTDSKVTEPSVIEAAIAEKSKEKLKKSNPIEDAKDEAIKIALASIEKEYGVGAIMKMDENAGRHIPRYPSGSLTLDLALGGGIPEGRIIEIYGPESSGKTTLSLHAIAEVQKKGGRAAFIDAEHALDIQYAKKIGVDIDSLLVSQPDCGEQALEICETLVRSGAISIIVIDSVAALTPRSEIEGNMGDAQMGMQARLMSQALRKLTAIVSKSGTSVIFINQIRMKIGVMFGNPETTAGGQALKFYSSLRLDVRRIDKILEKLPGEDGKASQEIVGNRTRVKVVKNKVAPPFRQAEFDILYAQGISKEGDILELGVKYGVLEKSGAYYRHGEDTIGQGKEQARIFLKENKKLAEKLEKEIRKLADI